MKTFWLVIFTGLLLPGLAQEAKKEPPPIELQFGFQLECPCQKFIGRLQNHSIPVFRTFKLGNNDNPIVFRDLDGKPVKTPAGYPMSVHYHVEPWDLVVPIQFRSGDSAWLDRDAQILYILAYLEAKNDLFMEMVWQNNYNRYRDDIKPFESNGMIIYFEAESKKFDQAAVPIRQDLDLILAPKFTGPGLESLVLFMRNNTRQKILAVSHESIVVLAATGQPALVEGKPFMVSMNKAKALDASQFIKEGQSLQDLCSAFAKTQLPAGFYRLHWQVEVEYADAGRKSFSSNELWVYHGKYEATKSVKEDLKPRKAVPAQVQNPDAVRD